MEEVRWSWGVNVDVLVVVVRICRNLCELPRVFLRRSQYQELFDCVAVKLVINDCGLG